MAQILVANADQTPSPLRQPQIRLDTPQTSPQTPSTKPTLPKMQSDTVINAIKGHFSKAEISVKTTDNKTDIHLSTKKGKYHISHTPKEYLGATFQDPKGKGRDLHDGKDTPRMLNLIIRDILETEH
jgi:hypothetical protein